MIKYIELLKNIVFLSPYAYTNKNQKIALVKFCSGDHGKVCRPVWSCNQINTFRSKVCEMTDFMIPSHLLSQANLA